MSLFKMVMFGIPLSVMCLTACSDQTRSEITPCPSTAQSEIAVCGTVERVVHERGEPLSAYRGDKFGVWFTDGRSLHMAGLPEITITPGGMYTFVIIKEVDNKHGGLNVLIRSMAADVCGYDKSTGGEERPQ